MRKKDWKYYSECGWLREVGTCPPNCTDFRHKDEVIVIRCKDCKHMEVTPDGLRWCNAWGGINGMGDEGFCNYGERKEQ